jgi:hypothetical protein
LSIFASRLFADNAQPASVPSGIRDNCVTVHGRIVEVGQRGARDQIAGSKTIEGARKRETPRGKRSNALQNLRPGLVLANHPPTFAKVRRSREQNVRN